MAVRFAKDGANVAILGKTLEPHPKQEGTLMTAAEEITKAGGNCLPIQCDIRNDESVKEAVEKTIK